MRSDLRKAGESTAYLVAREEYRAELRISIFRTLFIAILVIVNSIQAYLMGMNLGAEVLPQLVLLGLSMFMLIDIWWIGRSRHFSRFYRQGHKYLIISLDSLGFSALMYIVFRNSEIQSLLLLYGYDGMVLMAVGFLSLYALYIILDLLRFSVGSSYYALTCFTIGYSAVYYFSPSIMRNGFELAAFLMDGSVFFFPALFMTFLSAYVSKRLSQMVLESKIQQQLERYLPPALTRENMAQNNIELDASHGKKGPAAILFSDIRGFTSISENMSPQEVVDFLNEYFSDMIEVVFSHGGTLDKIVGDELMVLFGTPVFTDSYCDDAVLTALDMIEKLDAYNQMRTLQAKEQLHIGIGIHEGEVIFGSIGSLRRMDFTAIGDTVNTASRLERITRKLNSDIIISGSVLDKLGKKVRRSIDVTEHGRASVRGKQEKITIYSIKRK